MLPKTRFRFSKELIPISRGRSHGATSTHLSFLWLITGRGPIYSVWRLDAANASLAKGLVDKAIWAEANGLAGQGCFDRNRGDVEEASDSGYTAAEWDLHRAADFVRQAGFEVTEDDQEAEFGTPPAPLRCDNAAFYSGWYSLNHYNDAFTWNPGAIGYHLDSASALDPRGGPNWSANALIHGITVTSGAVAEPYLEGLPQADGVFRNIFEGGNVGDAFLRNTPALKWMILNMGDPLYRPFPLGFPAFNPAVTPQSALVLNPRAVPGGNSSTGFIVLTAPAPAGGTLVTLKSSDSGLAEFPDQVVVPEGSTFARFSIKTSAVTSDTPVQVLASGDGMSRSNTLILVSRK